MVFWFSELSVAGTRFHSRVVSCTLKIGSCMFLRLDAVSGVVNVQGVFETLEEFKNVVVEQ
jgi:hypothetical protein